ncbi:MAG: KH domain-containing protein, partial [Candidatus Heimdallarchaeaceae archaeon]
IRKVYTLSIKVKLPSGLKERDLSRPVVEVKDFHSHKLEYELYTFGEQIVVTPVQQTHSINEHVAISRKKIKRILKQYSGVHDFEFKITDSNSITLFVRNSDRAKIIGKSGKTIEKIESALNLNVDVRSYSEMSELNDIDQNNSFNEEAEYVINVYQSKNTIFLVFPDLCVGKDVDIMINGEVIVTLTVGKTAEIKLNINSELGSLFKEAYERGAVISALVR